MTETNLHTIVQRLQRLADADGPAAVPDAVLLRRFVGDRDAAAFELLVWRHGAMVLATCRRVLGPRPDVDDAFQATFLALVRQARSVRQSESLAGWLHRVAHRVSLHARKRAEQRAKRERPLDQPVAVNSPPSDWSDVRPLLDEEIERLPERLRLALVLCYLEGKTTEEAGRLLGCPKGTILSRLARARERLGRRLVRRGVTLAAGVAAFAADDALSAATVDAAVQTAGLVFDSSSAVAPAVAVLTEGVVRTMILSKIKTMAAGVLIVAAVLGAGTVAVTRPGLGAEDKGTAQEKGGTPAAKSPLDDLLRKAGNADSLKGTWKVVNLHVDGVRQDPDGMRWEFGPTSVRLIDGNREAITAAYTLNPSVVPAQIDLTIGGKTVPGTYSRNGNSMVVHMARGDGTRPKVKDTAGMIFQLELVPDSRTTDRNIGAESDPDALKKENARLLDALKAEQLRQAQNEQRLAEMERLAQDQRDRAIDSAKKAEGREVNALKRERMQAEDARAAEEQARRRAEDALKESVAQRQQAEEMQQRFNATLREKNEEIELLRSGLPADKWDAGWSEIRVNVDGHWSLRILADGSGIYGYGPNLDDFCTIPAGTFKFAQVRRDLLARSKLDSEGAKCDVSLKRKGEKGTLAVFSQDGAYALELLKTAHAKGSTQSLDARWERTPPQAGIRPTTMSISPVKNN